MPVSVDQQAFRDAMSRLGAAVNIITTDGPAGRHGLTASAVCSVTDTPPTLLVCVRRDSSAHEVLKVNGALCVNILAGRHQDLSDQFGRHGIAVEQRFAGGSWTQLDRRGGEPRLPHREGGGSRHAQRLVLRG